MKKDVNRWTTSRKSALFPEIIQVKRRVAPNPLSSIRSRRGSRKSRHSDTERWLTCWASKRIPIKGYFSSKVGGSGMSGRLPAPDRGASFGGHTGRGMLGDRTLPGMRRSGWTADPDPCHREPYTGTAGLTSPPERYDQHWRRCFGTGSHRPFGSLGKVTSPFLKP